MAQMRKEEPRMSTTAEDVVRTERIEVPPEGRYEFDLAHTTVEFVARHILTKVRGRFTDLGGSIQVGPRPEDSSVKVEIEAASISTGQKQRDEHLRSGDFLLVEEFPKITFTSTAVRLTGRSGFEIDGDLTIKDVTRSITLVGNYRGTQLDAFGNTVLFASAKAPFVREDWDLTWNMALEAGGFLVGKQVDIEIEVEARKAD
jgi:polyisoprenoid-binding protein YceI